MKNISKYGYWLFVLSTVVIRRVVFPLIVLALPIRGYLRNSVYNYHLENNIPLKRLLERKPVFDSDVNVYRLHNLHSPLKGIIHRRRVSVLEYYAILPLWLLLDDDCNADTFDPGFNETIINGSRMSWMPNFVVSSLIKDNKAYDKYRLVNGIIGNSFDLGDTRAQYPLYGFWSMFWWTLRNPAYNFNYKFNQLCDEEKAFKIIVFNRVFGWDVDGMLNGKPTFSWECGKKL